jgi:hypothetical protein
VLLTNGDTSGQWAGCHLYAIDGGSQSTTTLDMIHVFMPPRPGNNEGSFVSETMQGTATFTNAVTGGSVLIGCQGFDVTAHARLTIMQDGGNN